MSKEELKLILFLKSIGISGHYKGFYYLKDAVFAVLEDERRLCRMEKEIYRPIAERNHVSTASVARAIRTVCMTATANETQIRKYFPDFSCHGTLYPKELIELVADYVRYR